MTDDELLDFVRFDVSSINDLPVPQSNCTLVVHPVIDQWDWSIQFADEPPLADYRNEESPA